MKNVAWSFQLFSILGGILLLIGGIGWLGFPEFSVAGPLLVVTGALFLILGFVERARAASRR